MWYPSCSIQTQEESLPQAGVTSHGFTRERDVTMTVELLLLLLFGWLLLRGGITN
jgi:hypothetical protein